MIKHDLNTFKKGWVCGDIIPSLFNSKDVEVAIKRYKANDCEVSHVHKIATEYTIIISGEVLMNGVKYIQDDIIEIQPNEYTDFKCLTDVITCVIKTPSVMNDKFL